MAIPFIIKKFLARTGLARYTTIARRSTGNAAEFVRYYSDRTLAAPIEALCDPAAFSQADTPDMMNLNLSTPRFDSPISATRMIVDRSSANPAWGLLALREAIAQRARADDHRTLDPRTELFITHGATSAYTSALDAFVNPGDGVVLFDPSSPLFSIGAQTRRAKLLWVPTWNEEGRTRFLVPALARAMRQAMMIVLADPTHPSGSSFAPDELEQIAWLAKRHDVLVFLDRSLSRFRYSGKAVPLAQFQGFENRLLVADSVSQSHGLSSLRVGWLSGPKPLIQACAYSANISAPFVPVPCQQLALQALNSSGELFQPMLKEFAERRRYTLDRLRGMGLEPTATHAGFTTFVPVSHLGLTGRAFAERLLQEHQVLVGPGDLFGPTSTGSVRVSFAIEDGRLREGLSRIATMIDTIKGTPRVQATAIPRPVLAETEPAFSRT